MLLLAVCFFGYFAFLSYCEIRRVEPMGFRARFAPDGLHVEQVRPGSAADRAGLQPGDTIRDAGGRRLQSRRDWTVIEETLVFGRAIPLRVERGDRHLAVALTPRPAGAPFFRTAPGAVLLSARLTQLATLLIALLVAFKRPDDHLARLGAWLLASGGVFTIALPARAVTVWRDLPLALGVLMWPPFVSAITIGAVLFTFFASFPRPLIPMRWIAAAWVPMTVVTGWFLSSFALVVYAPDRIGPAPQTRVLMVTGATYAAAGFVALFLNYVRLQDVNERRRVRWILPGSAAALLSGIGIVINYWWRPSADVTAPIFSSPLMGAAAIVLLALPVSFAYAILRRRLFDLTTLLRQGVRYALARRVLVSVVPVLIVGIAVDLLMQRDRPLGDVLALRGTVYAALTGAALFAAWRREGWLASLDRRFFRERYDAQRLMRQLTAGLREAGTIGRAAPLLVGQLESALHPRFAALMIRAPGAAAFTTLASAPAGAAPQPIPDDWKVLSLARVLGASLQLSTEGDDPLTRQLPPIERRYLKDTPLELLLPVPGSAPAGEELMLVLGPKRSEEPYDADDIDLLSSAAEALTLVLERPRHETPAPVGLEECPACGRCYDSGTLRCPHEQQPLERALTDRLLARRYRLERRLGEGGMGKVYEASDLALERAVAVKLLRDEWIRGGNGADRFQLEARIAAGFAHPNVVTIHDFGVSAGRGFLVMELLRGKTLRDELRTRERLAPREAFEILKGACAAVDAAHSRNLIHRDLKPENIFLVAADSFRVVKVLDFGLARSVATGTPGAFATASALLGTPPYMAPEQLRGDEPSDGWDVWALSVIAYELVTGMLPFTSVRSLVTVGAGSLPATSPAPAWPDPPAERLRGELAALRPFFEASLSLDARSRPASVRRLLAAFDEATSIFT
jgi:serine/threonine-protein kinase